MAKGKSTGGLMATLVVAAIGVKLLAWIANNYISGADPTGTFSDLAESFTGIADLLFYALIALILLMIPFYLSRRKKNAVPDRSGPVERK
jgi:hypothetical protein